LDENLGGDCWMKRAMVTLDRQFIYPSSGGSWLQDGLDNSAFDYCFLYHLKKAPDHPIQVSNAVSFHTYILLVGCSFSRSLLLS
jgi:hypothetical protein